MLTGSDTSLDQSPLGLEDLIELLPDIVLVVAASDTQIILANAVALSAYGFTREHLLSLTIRDLRAPQSQVMLATQLASANAAGARFTTLHQRKDGTTFPVEVNSRGATFKRQRVLVSVVRDVSQEHHGKTTTESSAANAGESLTVVNVGTQLEATLATLLAALLAAPAGEIDRAITVAQCELCKVLGMDRSTIWQGSTEKPHTLRLTHMGTRDGVPPPLPDFNANVDFPWINEQLAAGRTVAMADVTDLPGEALVDRETYLRLGTRSSLAIPLVGRSGPIRRAISFGATTRREAWSEAVLAHCRLVAEVIGSLLDSKQSDEQLELVKTSIDRAPQAAYWIDADGNIFYANEQGCRALGYDREELLHAHVSLVSRSATPARWAEVFRAVKAAGSITLESEHCRKDGTRFPVEITSTYFQKFGREYCLGFAIDITERVRAQRERDVLQEQLIQTQKLESIGQLAGGVAHDFNNYLTVIQACAQQASEELDLTHPVQSDLTDIRVAAERSTDLTRQLLAFARKQTITPRVLDLNESVGGILKMLSRLLGKNLEIVWQPSAGLWPVLMDPSQIDQILANLCVNARDAITDFGTVAIEASNRSFDEDFCSSNPEFERGDYVEICVRDSGCGMDADTQSRIFEPFFTTKREGKGTGLGLATVYGIVKQNRGFLKVLSAPQQGTAIVIYLPRHQGNGELSCVDTPRAQEKGTETLLLVDDEATVLRLTARLLRKLGYYTIQANSPSEAMRIAREYTGEIHLLLTDVVMPEMNGRELATRLLSLRPGMKSLFMSGHSAEVITHHGVLEAGISFIQKPFTVQTLATKVRRLLDEARVNNPSG